MKAANIETSIDMELFRLSACVNFILLGLPSTLHTVFFKGLYCRNVLL
jgi:hypothetical protein